MLQSLTLDLSAPDEVLFKEFEELLRKLRGLKTNWGMPIDVPIKFNAWIKFGILPYMDLWIWGLETGTQIPNRVMADAIFPEGEGGEEIVRKSTGPVAKRLLETPALYALSAVAAANIQGKKIIKFTRKKK